MMTDQKFEVKGTFLMGEDWMPYTKVIAAPNENQARERTITDEQYWKYDADIKRWQLHSGLPDPTQNRSTPIRDSSDRSAVAKANPNPAVAGPPP